LLAAASISTISLAQRAFTNFPVHVYIITLASKASLTGVGNLALALRYQGKYEQAEEMDRRALAEYEKVLAVNHPNTLTSVSNLAVILQDQGKDEQAEEMYRRALAGREKVLGVDHSDTSTSVYCLANLLNAKYVIEFVAVARPPMLLLHLPGVESVLHNVRARRGFVDPSFRHPNCITCYLRQFQIEGLPERIERRQ
jgi:tetratricopeptide (TPR) repeat protein